MVYGRSITIGGCFLAIIILLAGLIFYLSMGPCPQGTFACDNGQKCVPQRRICNYRFDCIDESDEHPVNCGLLYGSKEMMNKIIGDRMKKRQQQQQLLLLQQQQQSQQHQNIEENVEKGVLTILPTISLPTSTEPVTTTTMTTNTTTNLTTTNVPSIFPDNTSTTSPENCSIVTYPKQCTCTKIDKLKCGPRSKLTRPFNISDEVTYLLISHTKITLRENIFSHLQNLEKLYLRYNNISFISAGAFNGLNNLKALDISFNNFRTLSSDDDVFRDLNSLQWLFLISNRMEQFPLANLRNLTELCWLKLGDNLLTLHDEKFPNMTSLREIYLNKNRITYIDKNLFAALTKPHLLDLSWNLITRIHSEAFWSLKDLRDLRLIGNPLKKIADETFSKNLRLDALSLSDTPLKIDSDLIATVNVSYLNLTGIGFDSIDFVAISRIKNLQYIVFDHFYYCSMTPQVRMCKPNTDGVSSFQDLLSKPVLRYSAWTMAVITICGNIMVLWGRFIYRDENFAVTMVIRNLALADMLMGFYLLTIGTQDLRYRNSYKEIAFDWINSWQCAATGVLAVISSEVSMFILAFMSLERFLLIADPFRGHHRISHRNIFAALLAIWIIGVGIAVAPVALWYSSTKFYGTYSGTCFPLHVQEVYPLGWEYSAFMFLGVNFGLLLMIAFLYTALLISIWRTRQATPLSLLDCEFAVRFFFIVLTDVLCWAPIIISKIWVFFKYNISDDIYAWLVVFILPLNSAVNPLLYTFTTPKYRNQILLRGWKKITARKRADPSTLNGIATTTATATGSSNPEESSGRAIPLVISR